MNHTYGKTVFNEHCVMAEDLSAIKYFSTYALASFDQWIRA